MKPNYDRTQSAIGNRQSRIKNRLTWAVPLLLILASPAFSAGIPEPGLVMYGAVRNTAAGNARLITGTLTWTITPASGSPITVTTPLTDISGQYSYALRVPFESVVGSSTLSPNTLALNSANTSYVRTNVVLTVNGTNYPCTIAAPALGSFTFNKSDRGRLEEVGLTVSAPGIGVPPPAPFFSAAPHLVNGKFQIALTGTPGQSYTLLTSTDLVTWVPLSIVTFTTGSTVLTDPTPTNATRRFYKLGP